MKKILFQTNDSAAPLLARVFLGVVMFPHGAQKMLGWFGGHGFSASMENFTTGMHIPAFLAFLVIMAEFAGSLGLIVGLLSRVAAFGIGAMLTGAILMAHAGNGFFILAAQAGRLDVAAVLSSLYPVTTLILAALILKERVVGVHALGVAAAIAAIVLVRIG